jgi:hypothetical protein
MVSGKLTFKYVYIDENTYISTLITGLPKQFLSHKSTNESVNRSQMDIKRKTCNIQAQKKHLFLNISSANTDILVPSLYHCIETRNIEEFWLLSQPLPQLVGHHLGLSNFLERLRISGLLDFFHRPVFQRLENTFWKLDLFLSSGEGGRHLLSWVP